MVKTQPSLFIFNKDSHLEGIMHYNTTLNSLTDFHNRLRLNDSKLLDEEDFDEEDNDDYLDVDDLDDEEDFEYDLDDSDEESD